MRFIFVRLFLFCSALSFQIPKVSSENTTSSLGSLRRRADAANTSPLLGVAFDQCKSSRDCGVHLYQCITQFQNAAGKVESKDCNNDNASCFCAPPHYIKCDDDSAICPSGERCTWPINGAFPFCVSCDIPNPSAVYTFVDEGRCPANRVTGQQCFDNSHCRNGRCREMKGKRASPCTSESPSCICVATDRSKICEKSADCPSGEGCSTEKKCRYCPSPYDAVTTAMLDPNANCPRVPFKKTDEPDKSNEPHKLDNDTASVTSDTTCSNPPFSEFTFRPNDDHGGRKSCYWLQQQEENMEWQRELCRTKTGYHSVKKQTLSVGDVCCKACQGLVQ